MVLIIGMMACCENVLFLDSPTVITLALDSLGEWFRIVSWEQVADNCDSSCIVDKDIAIIVNKLVSKIETNI